MSIGTATLIWMGIGIYLAIGLIFGLAFISFGAKRIDPAAAIMPLRAKAIILPGSILLWPVLVAKWLRRTEPPAT